MAQQRNYYRIRFPEQERPRLLAGDATYEVLDLSEEGARLSPDGLPRPDWTTPVAVALLFRDGTLTTATAVVQRESTSSVTVRFGRNLPMSVIVSEQQRLLALYGKEAIRSLTLEAVG